MFLSQVVCNVITFRKMRRRRISLFKLFLLFFLLMGVIYWIYQIQIIRPGEPPERQQQSFVFPRSAENHALELQKVHKKPEKFVSLFEKFTKDGSAFKNPALLHKLQAKTSNRPKTNDLSNNKKLDNIIESDLDMPVMKVTPGLGEGGVPVHLSSKEQKLADEVFHTAAFNVYLSDRISLNRSVPDPRNPK